MKLLQIQGRYNLCLFIRSLYKFDIGCLPKSQRKYVILVVVDQLTKYAHFIALAYLYTKKAVAQAFLDNVFKLHGQQNTIVSNRGSIFISAFWQEFFKLQGVPLYLSTT